MGLLHSVFLTTLQMLSDREYIVPRLDYSLPDFVNDFCEYDETIRAYVPVRERMTLSLIHKVDRNKNMRVFFYGPPMTKVGKPELQKLLANIGEDRVRALFVFSNGITMTPPAKKLIREMNRDSPYVMIEAFSESELVVNITRHGKQDRVYSIYFGGADMNKLPMGSALTLDDPVARYFGLKRGEILKCVSSSECGGRLVRFRRSLYAEEIDRKPLPRLGRDT